MNDVLDDAPTWNSGTCLVGRFRSTFKTEDLEADFRTVLDAGCSNGEVTMELSRIYPAAVVLGMELHEGRLPERKIVRNNNGGVVIFKQGNFYRIDRMVPPEIFDAIFAMNNLVLEDRLTLEQHRTIARNLNSVLTEGGYLFLSDSLDYVILCKTGKGFRKASVNSGFRRPLIYGKLSEAYGI